MHDKELSDLLGGVGGVIDHTAIAMAVVSPAGVLVRVNPAMCELLGYSRSELEELTFHDITYPDDLAESTGKYVDLLEGRIDGFTLRKRYLTGHGQPVWVNVVTSAVRDSHGGLLCTIAQLMNINVRMASESTLRRQMGVLADVVQSLADLAIEVDTATGRILWASDGCLPTLGRPAESLLGSPVQSIVAPTPDHPVGVEVLADMLSGSLASQQPARLRTASGEFLDAWATLGHPLESPDRLVIGFRLDHDSPAGSRGGADQTPAEASREPVSDYDHWLALTVKEVLSAVQERWGASWAAVQLVSADGHVSAVHRSEGCPVVAEWPADIAPATVLDLRSSGALVGRLALPADVTAVTDSMFLGLCATSVRNAVLLAQARRQGRLAESGVVLMLAAEQGVSAASVMRLFAEHLRTLLPHEAVFAIEPDPDYVGQLVRTIPLRWGASKLESHTHYDATASLHELLTSGRSATGNGPLGLAEIDTGIGPWAIVSIDGGARPRQAILIARAPGAPEFSEGELKDFETLGSRLSYALQLGQARQAQEEILLREDRERVSRDLHDLTIQRLFGVGLMLQAQGHEPIPPAVAADVVDELNQAILELRASISELSEALPDLAGWDVEGIVLREVGRSQLAPSIELTVDVDIPKHDRYSPHLVKDLTAVIREGLSNVASHTRARTAHVSVRIAAARLLVEIVATGSSAPSPVAPGRGKGLSSLRNRARRLGGELVLTLDPDGTSRLTWWVPYPAQDPAPEDA